MIVCHWLTNQSLCPLWIRCNMTSLRHINQYVDACKSRDSTRINCIPIKHSPSNRLNPPPIEPAKVKNAAPRKIKYPTPSPQNLLSVIRLLIYDFEALHKNDLLPALPIHSHPQRCRWYSLLLSVLFGSVFFAECIQGIDWSFCCGFFLGKHL